MTYDPSLGAVVLFGGWASDYVSNLTGLHLAVCSDATWTYHAGTWTNLSLPAALSPPAYCNPLMVYDPPAGAIVLYARALYNGTSNTWEFKGGVWKELNISTPHVYSSNAGLTYDATDSAVMLTGLAWDANQSVTYLFKNSSWTQVAHAVCEWEYGCPLTFDAAIQAPVVLGEAELESVNGSGLTLMDYWAFENGTWVLLPGLEDEWGTGALAYDPEFGDVVEYGGTTTEPIWEASDPNFRWQNNTSVYANGVWTNNSIGGPPATNMVAMTFDESDGYLLLYGGLNLTTCTGALEQSCSPSPWDYPAAPLLQNETWFYSNPPSWIQLGISTSPSPICSAASENCGVGSDTTQVTLTVTSGVGALPEAPGVDAGNGSVTYGPEYWLDRPAISYAPWRNFTQAIPLAPSANCRIPGVNDTTCSTEPTVTYVGSSRQVDSWSWGTPPGPPGFVPGDSWTISFHVEALGPPFGTAPLDACSTGACSTAGVRSAPSYLTQFAFDPNGTNFDQAASFPLGTVEVLPPQPQNGGPPPTPPPPPAPPVGAPLPAGATPNPVPTPVGSLVPVVLGGLISLVSPAAAGAGVVAAGLTRAALAPPGRALRVSVGSRPSRSRTVRHVRERGEN